MKISDFTENKDVSSIVAGLKSDGIDRKVFSDVVDSLGNQYVEMVMEGGGVLGVALIGYTYVLEQMGIRFFSLAGTSAGSINAMMLAGQGDISKAKSDKVIDELVNKNLFDFVDGNKDSKDFIGAILAKTKRIKLVWKAMQILDEIFDDLGLNPGDDFTRWLSAYLDKYGIRNQVDLEASFCVVPPGLAIRPGVAMSLSGLRPKLAIIAAELNTETKVEFPAMSPLYWKDPKEINPALYVRASMSIPYFFVPFHLQRVPQGPDAKKLWEELVKYNGPVPSDVYLVDGGIMSNFPINVFHKVNSVPRLPTFGVRLGVDRDKLNKIKSPLSLFGAMFNSLRHLHDYDFILKNPDYSRLIAKIDIGHHDWLNFALDEKAKVDLFRRGAETAAAFLREFDWEGYKKIRAQMKEPVDE